MQLTVPFLAIPEEYENTRKRALKIVREVAAQRGGEWDFSTYQDDSFPPKDGPMMRGRAVAIQRKP